ncbi:MAG: PAS domain S-box protein [Anaerolineaceae bacterium]|nr:MAG: PAS domain S-box protein [Anaerolineaceae bacterium]
MNILPFVYGIAAGISLYSSAYHMFIGLRQNPHNRSYLLFSLLTFLIAGVIITDGGYRLASTNEQILTLLRIGISVTGLALIVLVWFVAAYTAVQPRLFLVVLSLVWAVLVLINQLSPYSILYADITGVAENTMPWGEAFITIEGTPSSWQTVNIALFFVTFGFIFYAIVQQYRRGEQRAASLLLLGIAPIILGTIFDFLIDFGVITNFVGLYPISYVGLVLIMSLVLADEVVKAGVLQREVAENERRWRSMLENIELVVIGLDVQGRINYTNPFFSKVTHFSSEEVDGKDAFRILIPAHMQTEMQDVFSGFLETDTNRYYQNPIVTKDGAERMISWANVRLRDSDNQVIGTLSIGNDITDRTRTEKELEHYREQLQELVEERTSELTRVVTELNTLNQIAKSVAAFVDLQDTLQNVCEMVAPLFNAAVVVVNVFDLETEAVNLLAGYDRDVVDGRAAGVGQTLPLVATRMMQQVSHTGQALTAAGLLSQDEADSPLLTERHIDALLLEPLRSRGEIIGVLGILRDEPAAVFDENDVILAETIAGYVAAAIENTQLSQQLTDAAVTEERNRIARELHDSVTQNLYTVATISDTVPDIWDTHPEETRKALNNLRRLSRGALAEMRILLLELRPSSLLEKSLGQLLQQLGEGIEGRSRIQATTSIVSDQIFPDDVQVALYRIAQEALNNVIKHSEATQATIGLYHVPDQVTLSVRDNGRGFDMQTMEYGGFGLENMQERARQIDAKLDIKSELKKGTEITVIWRPQDQENE